MAILFSTADNQIIEGTGDGDLLIAGHTNITLSGGAGDDTLQSTAGAIGTKMDGGPGLDILTGAGENDTAYYGSASSPVVVDLANRFALDGTGSIDLLFGIENATGSGSDDTLTGDGNANILSGGVGDDVISGAGGKDTLIGGEGEDRFGYSFTMTTSEALPFRFTDFFASKGGSVESGTVAVGTTQAQFSSLYTQWLEMLVRDHGMGTAVLDLGQNSGLDGTPVVENMTGEFGERESFTWQSGSAKKPVFHERWYSDTWTPGEGGQPTAESEDGHDTIVGFEWGTDQLEFGGLLGVTLDQFVSMFTVTESNVGGGSETDTVLALADNSWSVTLLDVSGHTEADFHSSIFS